MTDLRTGTCPHCYSGYAHRFPDRLPAFYALCDACGLALLHRRQRETPEVGEAIVLPPGPADAKAAKASLLRQMRTAVERVPILPEVANRVLRLANDPECSLQDLAALIRNDQALAIRILRLANSAAFRGQNEIRDLDTACARLGIRQVCDIVVGIAHRHVYQATDKRLRRILRGLWTHSIGTAAYAESVAKLLRFPYYDAAFVAGLTHDAGKLLLLDTLTQSTERETLALRSSADSINTVLRVLHPLGGLHVAKHWNLPEIVGVTIMLHHQPDAAPDPALAPLIHAVAWANTASHVGKGEQDSAPAQPLLDHPSAIALELSEAAIAQLVASTGEKLAAYKAAFALEP